MDAAPRVQLDFEGFGRVAERGQSAEVLSKRVGAVLPGLRPLETLRTDGQRSMRCTKPREPLDPRAERSAGGMRVGGGRSGLVITIHARISPAGGSARFSLAYFFFPPLPF